MNRKSSWMAQLKARICDERGLSLLELLAVLTVLGIVGSVMTSTLVTGQKIFTKQTAETQFREDADYVTTRIMNEFYSTPFDEVEMCTPAPCIRIIDSTDTSYNAVENENQDSETDYFYDLESSKKDTANETVITIVDEQVHIQKATRKPGEASVLQSDELLETRSLFTGSNETFNLAACAAETEGGSCTSGTMELLFTLSSDRTNEQMTLESRFGF